MKAHLAAKPKPAAVSVPQALGSLDDMQDDRDTNFAHRTRAVVNKPALRQRLQNATMYGGD